MRLSRRSLFRALFVAPIAAALKPGLELDGAPYTFNSAPAPAPMTLEGLLELGLERVFKDDLPTRGETYERWISERAPLRCSWLPESLQ